MMTHNMYSVMPETFRAVMPVFGLPLIGHIDVPTELRNTSILLLHDRSDTVIPVDGGWADGWQVGQKFIPANALPPNYHTIPPTSHHPTDTTDTTTTIPSMRARTTRWRPGPSCMVVQASRLPRPRPTTAAT